MGGVREGEKHIVHKSFLSKTVIKKTKTLKVELHLAHTVSVPQALSWRAGEEREGGGPPWKQRDESSLDFYCLAYMLT